MRTGGATQLAFRKLVNLIKQDERKDILSAVGPLNRISASSIGLKADQTEKEEKREPESKALSIVQYARSCF